MLKLKPNYLSIKRKKLGRKEGRKGGREEGKKE
jgi:hypothetical protein